MATIVRSRPRSIAAADEGRSGYRTRNVGLAVAAAGLGLVAVAFVANLVAAGDATVRAGTLPWSFGLTTLGLGTVKLAIGIILWGILMKLWLRIGAARTSLDRMVTVGKTPLPFGETDSPFGRMSLTRTPPANLPIHRMARRLWLPMLVMGYVVVAAGFVVSLVWAGRGGLAAAAWTQGLQFLGEAMLLSGISFLLGTILWAIRTGGGEVQEGLGVTIKTLLMPATAKIFVALMMLGIVISLAQFAGYLIVASGGVNGDAWLSFLGPLRELGLGVLLSGITMALVTVGNALGFQFSRIVELLQTGR